MTKLEQAHYYINKNEIEKFFSFMENNGEPNEMLARLEHTFIFGKIDADFGQRCKVLASMLFSDTEKNDVPKKNQSNDISRSTSQRNTYQIGDKPVAIEINNGNININ